VTQPIKIGAEMRTWYKSAGVGGAGDWEQLTCVKDMALNLEHDDVDVTTRAAGGFKETIAGLTDAPIEFDMIGKEDDAGMLVILNAFMSKKPVGLAIMNGAATVAEGTGLIADFAILKCNRNEALADAVGYSVTAKPTYSNTAAGFYINGVLVSPEVES